MTTRGNRLGRKTRPDLLKVLSLLLMVAALVLPPALSPAGGPFVASAQDGESCESDPDPCAGDPNCGDPCGGDPCCNDPSCGDPCYNDPNCGQYCFYMCEQVCGDNETCLDWDECTNTCYLWGDEVCWEECEWECYG